MSEPQIVSLADLGIDEDPGTAWHPRLDKEGVRDADGLLVDLDEDEQAQHLGKPEYRDEGVLAAEDSAETPDDEV